MNAAATPTLNSLDLPEPPAETRVVVAMSGGVDSSVVAALLKEQGYDVVGVTLQLYDQGEPSIASGACCAGQDIFDARQAAEQIGIPHYVLDYESRFRKKVIDAFAQSYADGETPIPCVTCNQQIKFVDLFDMARDLGADALATGHYIASRADGDGAGAVPGARRRPRPELFPVRHHARAIADAALSARRHEQAGSARTCPPLRPRRRRQARQPGHLLRADRPLQRNRRKARAPGGHAGRHRPYRWAHARPPRRRDELHHRPAARPWPRRRVATGGEPLYVVKIDAAHTQVTVGPRSALATRRVFLRDVNWIGPGSFEQAAAAGAEIAVRVRSTRPPAPALLELKAGEPCVEFLDDESGVAPGQACVFYDAAGPRARVLGGGFIKSAEPAGLTASLPAAHESAARA